MPWLRLDENCLDHPKLIGFVDYRRPFDVWVWGLSYAQKHLTDGRLPRVAVPKGSEKAVAELLKAGLWVADPETPQYLIHDYFQWNDARSTVLAKREGAKLRARKSRTSRDQRAPHGGPPPFAHDAGGEGDLGSTSTNDQDLEGAARPQLAPVKAAPVDARRAGALLETYRNAYPKYRNGARLPLVSSPAEFQKAIDLVTLWDDARLGKLIEIFLTSDEPWIAATDRKFAVFASKATWCDDRLAAWEAKRRHA